MRKVLLFTSFTVLLASLEAHAFRLTPMVAELSPSGPKATQTFLLDNSGKEKAAVQIEVTTREVDGEGNEKRNETEGFLIFPEQITMEPGERRNVRVTYTGPKELTKEMPYRLIASQLPVQLKNADPSGGGARASVNFLLQYVASLYVTPDDSKPKIEVESIKALKSGEAELVLKNSGTRHKVLTDMKLVVHSKAGDWTPSKEDIKNIISENILPQASRRFVLKGPPKNLVEPLTASISF